MEGLLSTGPTPSSFDMISIPNHPASPYAAAPPSASDPPTPAPVTPTSSPSPVPHFPPPPPPSSCAAYAAVHDVAPVSAFLFLYSFSPFSSSFSLLLL